MTFSQDKRLGTIRGPVDLASAETVPLGLIASLAPGFTTIDGFAAPGMRDLHTVSMPSPRSHHSASTV